MITLDTTLGELLHRDCQIALGHGGYYVEYQNGKYVFNHNYGDAEVSSEDWEDVAIWMMERLAIMWVSLDLTLREMLAEHKCTVFFPNEDAIGAVDSRPAGIFVKRNGVTHTLGEYETWRLDDEADLLDAISVLNS